MPQPETEADKLYIAMVRYDMGIQNDEDKATLTKHGVTYVDILRCVHTAWRAYADQVAGNG